MSVCGGHLHRTLRGPYLFYYICGGHLHRKLRGPYLLYYICGGQLHRTLRGPYFLYYICLNTNTEHAQMSTSKENKCYAKEHNQIFEVSTQVQTTKKSLRAGSGLPS
jgi:hypothetical protein